MSRMTAFLRCHRAAVWPTCSCTSTYTKTEKCKTVATSGLGNRFFKIHWFWRWWRVETSHNHTRTSLCFFSFGPWITASDSYQSRRRSMVLLRSISPTPGGEVFILTFGVPSPKWLFSLGITIAVRQGTPALLWKKKGNFQKILEVIVGVRNKMPGDRAEFQKELQDIVKTKRSSARMFGAKSYKSAGKPKSSSKWT